MRSDIAELLDVLEFTPLGPEERRRTGAYYTPRWLVSFMCRAALVDYLAATVAPDTAVRLLGPPDGSVPELLSSVEARRLREALLACRVCDPAVGAGAFLVGMLHEMTALLARLDAPPTERRHLLTACLYGSDVQPAALRQCALRLCLAVDAVPDLAGNLHCGDVLLEEPFGTAPAFDIVIGNPPYAGFHGLAAEYKARLRRRYRCAAGRFDFYMPFLERGLQFLRPGGTLVYLCPTTFLKRAGGAGLRALLRERYGVRSLVDFGAQQLFAGATTYLGIVTLTTEQPPQLVVQHARAVEGRLQLEPALYPATALPPDGAMWFLPTGPARRLWEELRAGRLRRLGELMTITEGIVTGKNEVFLLDAETAAAWQIERELLHPCARGAEVRPYVLERPRQYVLYPYDLASGAVYDEDHLRCCFPGAYRYLCAARARLAGRRYFERSGKRWYELWNERRPRQLAATKILVAELGDRNSFALAGPEVFYGDTVCGLTLGSPEPACAYRDPELAAIEPLLPPAQRAQGEWVFHLQAAVSARDPDSRAAVRCGGATRSTGPAPRSAGDRRDGGRSLWRECGRRVHSLTGSHCTASMIT